MALASISRHVLLQITSAAQTLCVSITWTKWDEPSKLIDQKPKYNKTNLTYL